MHVMENVAFIFQLVAVLYSMVNNVDCVAAEECSPRGDMCDIDEINCLLNLRNNYEISECYGIVFEPETPSIDRGPINFWISIDDEELDTYPPNLTYSVYRMDNFNDSGIPSYLKKVDGCCNMGLNDKCTLPKTELNEIHTVYVTTATDPNGNIRYCEAVIDEDNPYRNCENEEDYLCYELKEGVLHFKDILESSSTMADKIDFCFFPIQDSAISDFPEIPDDHEGGNPLWMRKDYFAVGLDDCFEVKHEKGPNEKLSEKVSYTDIVHDGIICFYTKIRPKNWGSYVGCSHMSTGSPIAIRVSMLVLSTLLLILIAAAFCHKKGIVRHTYKRSVQDMQIRVATETVDNNNKEPSGGFVPLAWNEGSREAFYPFSVYVACNTVQENKSKSDNQDWNVVSVAKCSENTMIEMDKLLSDQRMFENDTGLDRTVTQVER